MAHRQTWVKVNAPVDEGVASLVSALSAVPGLETIESCEGEPGQAPAFVLFRYGHWRQCGALLFKHLLPALPPKIRAYVTVSLQVFDCDNVIGRIAVDSEALEDLASYIQKLAAVGMGVPVASDAHGDDGGVKGFTTGAY